ncbi:MAG TPA: ATP-dependent DNA helicase RecG [Verrucomicrobiae bacterium]|nr:ATP-dependent DNA helicase RecG [Verrucomicrobiae bacterium]
MAARHPHSTAHSSANASPAPLALPVTTLRGVGPERAEQLKRLGIGTIEDLLLHRPRRYEDRRKFLPIRELELGQPATVRGRVVVAGIKRWKQGSRALFECIFEDDTARLHCRWWQASPWMESYYTVGREFMIFGKPESLRPRTFDHPETEPLEAGEDEFIHVNRIVPVHPLTEGLTARVLRTLVWRALERLEPSADQRGPASAPAPAPEELAPGLPSRAAAIRGLHFPAEMAEAELARRRLALDEFIELQRGVLARRRRFEANARAWPCGGDNRLIKPFLARLEFKLTDAQTRVLREIRDDLRGAHPMRRLLQGDVGSGKTAVAACAALMTLESGFNVALMAPTEILAEQHFRNFQRWLEPLGVKVELRTGSWKTANETPPATHRVDGGRAPSATLTIGTHALLNGAFDLPHLGLVIIDEQHKFGTSQREALVRKGHYPHLLVMTATPIPRTLGLTLYGDLDSSTIDALPAGRGRIRTFVRLAEALPKVWPFVKEKLREGRQAYVVYPRVDDNGGNVKAVTQELERVQRALAPFHVGLLHGRLPAREKEAVMQAFRAGEVQVLLATSLIEVGVDVPNATVMLIENAEQFGLAQLHQLRGRIGRGAHASFCILVSNADNPEARARLKVLADTTDGFQIAEADLRLRGPGELLGQQQSGAARFRFGDLATDLDLIRQARAIAASAGGTALGIAGPVR